MYRLRMKQNEVGQVQKVWHSLSVQDVMRELGTDLGKGLSGSDASTRLAKDGKNELAIAKGRSAFTIMIHQFRSLMVGLLIATGGVALALGDFAEAVAIVAVIVINALIGFVTEMKAASALAGITLMLRRNGPSRNAMVTGFAHVGRMLGVPRFQSAHIPERACPTRRRRCAASTHPDGPRRRRSFGW